MSKVWLRHASRLLVLTLVFTTALVFLPFGIEQANAETATETVVTGSCPGAMAVNTDTNKIYVANEASDTVTVIDGATNTTATIAVGDYPISLALNQATNKIYVANWNDNTVTVINGATGTTAAAIGVWNNPRAVAVNPITNKIYVISDDFTVKVINGVTDNVETAIDVASRAPIALAVNQATNKIYVANYNDDTVTVIDGATDTVPAAFAYTINVGDNPQSLAVNQVTNIIYVANYNHNTVTVINGATDTDVATVETTVGVGAGPYGLTVNQTTNKIYVSNNTGNTVTVINGADNNTATINVGTGPCTPAVDPITNRIYVANYDDNTVSVINGATNTTATVNVGINPYTTAVNSVTNKIYVANQDSDNVTVLTIDPLSISTAVLPAGNVGTSYSSGVLSAAGGISPYSWSATGLPAGLDINTVTGEVYGTPTAAGTSTVSFTVTDSITDSKTEDLSLSINSTAPPTHHDHSSSTPTPTAYTSISVGTFKENLAVSIDKTNGGASVSLDRSTLDAAFNQAGISSDGVKTVKIEMPELQGVNTYVLQLPAAALDTEDTGRIIELETEAGTIMLPGNMLEGIELESTGNVGISIGKADRSKLPQEVQDRIGEKPVVELKLTVGNETVEWNSPNAPVAVSIPYTPTAEELANPEHITIWYIDGSGNVISVPNGRYDPATGAVTFTTTHFSNYAVAYVAKTFHDLERVAWARKPIEVLASKGILKGTSEIEYTPQVNITRADFLCFLVRTLSVDARVDGNFDDISSKSYYYKEIGIAKKLGITAGIGNNKFDPDANLTRQDMMVLTERALRILKKLGQQGTASDLEKFADKSLIAVYAEDSVASVVKEELIVGSSGKVNPLGNTTRAEAAVFLYRIYNKY